MPAHKAQRGLELATRHNIHTEPLPSTGTYKPGAQNQVRSRNSGAHQVVGAHHLGPSIRLEGAEDVVLGTIREAIEQQVHAQQQQSVHAIPGLAALLATRLAGVQREHRHARRHGGHNQILVQRIPALEDGDVQQHDGEQLAALGEQEGDVVDVGEGRVAEGGCERACERDEQQRRQDPARGYNRRDGLPARRAEVQVQRAGRRGEQRLDRVKEHRVLEDLGGPGRAVWCRRELLL